MGSTLTSAVLEVKAGYTLGGFEFLGHFAGVAGMDVVVFGGGHEKRHGIIHFV